MPTSHTALVDEGRPYLYMLHGAYYVKDRDHAQPYPYMLHGAYCVVDRDTRPKVW